MRIGLSTSVIQRGQTGIAQYVFALIRAFLESAAQHQYVLFVLEEDLPLFAFAGNAMQLVPVSEWVRPPVRNILWHQARLPALARAHRLDVLHVPSYRRMLWPRPCALVSTIHDLAPFQVARKYDWKRMLYARSVARRLARRQDEIIAISRNTGRDIRTHFGIPPAQITVIANGLDHGHFFPASTSEAKAAVAERYGLRQPFFLYVSRLEHPAKNHVRLIQAFDQFKVATDLPWQLVLVGSDWHGAAAIHARVQQSPFAHDIHCPGFVGDTDLPILYRAAEVFVYPSLFEGFGMPPVEAMACGCPVLCSDRGSLGEVVGNAALIVDPDDTNALKLQLARLAHNPALRDYLRAAGLKHAQRFNWQTTASATLEVYERAMEKAKRSRSTLAVSPAGLR